jgi:pilus assembly protein CpaF
LRRKNDRGAVTTAGAEASAGASAAVEAHRHHLNKRDRVRREISDLMLTRVDPIAASTSHTDGEKFARLRDTIDGLIGDIVAGRSDINDFSLQDHAEMKQEILDEQLGLGPLEDLMRDPTVSEIMVNGPQSIYVERAGKLTLSNRTFSDARQLRLVIERIVAPLGRRIDESSPMVDARLPDGSRVNAIIEPLSLKGATLTIRRFGTKRLVMDDLVRLGSLPQPAVAFLAAIVQARLNVVVSGGTGSGKTTFLNILSHFIPDDERIVTIEDAAELSLSQAHVVSLESRPMNIEGRGEVTVRELVKNSLRMRPDRIVVGECRGGEALDMLQAMNTGHDGSLTTLHANSPRDALARLETLVMMAGFDLPIAAIREQIASAVDIVIQIERMRDGTRKITRITEVVGMDGALVVLQDIVAYQSRGLDANGAVIGAFQYSGVVPHFLGRFEEMGVPFDPAVLEQLEHGFPALPLPA